jgi:hypothetical protein
LAVVKRASNAAAGRANTTMKNVIKTGGNSTARRSRSESTGIVDDVKKRWCCLVCRS